MRVSRVDQYLRRARASAKQTDRFPRPHAARSMESAAPHAGVGSRGLFPEHRSMRAHEASVGRMVLSNSMMTTTQAYPEDEA